MLTKPDSNEALVMSRDQCLIRDQLFYISGVPEKIQWADANLVFFSPGSFSSYLTPNCLWPVAKLSMTNVFWPDAKLSMTHVFWPDVKLSMTHVFWPDAKLSITHDSDLKQSCLCMTHVVWPHAKLSMTQAFSPDANWNWSMTQVLLMDPMRSDSSVMLFLLTV